MITDFSSIRTKIPDPRVWWFDHASMRDRRTPEGMVRVWCVGLVRVGDGGQRVRNAKINSKEKGVKGDWRWSYSPEQ